MVAQISRHRETFATFETRMNLHTRGRIFSDCKIYVWIFLDASSHLYKRVYRSVRPSVHNACAKNRVSRLFLATVRFYTETNDQPTCFESLLYYFTRLFVHLSHDQYTQRHSPDASLPGRACFFFQLATRRIRPPYCFSFDFWFDEPLQSSDLGILYSLWWENDTKRWLELSRLWINPWCPQRVINDVLHSSTQLQVVKSYVILTLLSFYQVS